MYLSFKHTHTHTHTHTPLSHAEGVYMPSSPEERGKNPDWADDTRKTFHDKLDENKDGL